MSTKKITLEVGKKYKTLGGRQITIEESVVVSQSLFFIASDGRIYSDDGQRYLGPKDCDVYQNDPIMSLLMDSESPSENTLQLELGKTYVTRSGRTVIITECHGDILAYGSAIFEGSDGVTYGSKGELLINHRSLKDLRPVDDIVKELVNDDLKAMSKLNLVVGRSYHTESDLLIKIKSILVEGVGYTIFEGDNNLHYLSDGKCLSPFGHDLLSEHTTKPIQDPIEYLNTLPGFKEAVTNVEILLWEGGHCGEGSSEHRLRSAWNDAVEAVCSKLLNKKEE